MPNKISANTESELLLNIKDIEKAKAENIKAKQEDKAITIDASLTKYNKAYLDAVNAPTPNIKLPFSEILVRAVPVELKTRSGLIISTGDTDMKIADRLGRMVDAVQQVQEILLIGDLVDKEKFKVGDLVKIKLDRFRTLSDRHHPGMIESEYQLPIEVIDGYKYMIIDQRDVLYTKPRGN